MLFGQSVFQSVLTRLKEEEKVDKEELSDTAAGFRVRGLGTGFVASTAKSDEIADAPTGVFHAYLLNEPSNIQEPIEATPAPEPVEPEPDPIPAYLLRLTEAQIAEELAITVADTELVLNEKRRAFAKRNHPDSVAPQWRDHATTRMTIANLLIDNAIRTTFWR